MSPEDTRCPPGAQVWEGARTQRVDPRGSGPEDPRQRVEGTWPQDPGSGMDTRSAPFLALGPPSCTLRVCVLVASLGPGRGLHEEWAEVWAGGTDCCSVQAGRPALNLSAHRSVLRAWDSSPAAPKSPGVEGELFPAEPIELQAGPRACRGGRASGGCHTLSFPKNPSPGGWRRGGCGAVVWSWSDPGKPPNLCEMGFTWE